MTIPTSPGGEPDDFHPGRSQLPPDLAVRGSDVAGPLGQALPQPASAQATVDTTATAGSRATAGAGAKEDGNPPAVLGGGPTASDVSAVFANDTAVRGALTGGLRQRTAATQLTGQRAKNALAGFSLSRYSAEQRAQANYLAPGDDLHAAIGATVNQGIEALRSSTVDRSLRLSLSADARAKLKLDPTAVAGQIDLGRLIDFINRQPGAGFHGRRDVFTACEADIEAERRLAQIHPGATTGASPNGTTAGTIVLNGGTPANGSAPAGDGTARAAQLVDDEVSRQMGTSTSPESPLVFAVPQRASGEDNAKALQTFELRTGASDVTSYHDFASLQLAFQHVWTEVFDGDLKTLGEQLYHEYVKLRSYAGVDDGTDRPISTATDLNRLLTEIRDLSQSVASDTPPPVQAHGPWALVAAITGQGAPPPPPPPPPGKPSTGTAEALDNASRLQQLLARTEKLLAEKYAFEVFAPNSLNLGFIATYRQTWEPQSYQVGDLVSTIPLAPREVRRYSTKKVVKKTRAVKELEDSLRTTRSESGETHRADKEIVDKAQTKSNFNLMAHESFGGEGYQIDSTQNFGGDQSKQSERTKKEFHEAVQKAAQEYRQQHRTEIETNESSETEETTFAEIQNPNDELTVTYLFYELQRTYKVTERIHKLTPVILVANDVPAPHDIDDAWLLQHDWVLSRVILDDSFRPALRYLVESFVGAETNIRILEANATAQKSIVDTLRQQVVAQDTILTADEKSVLDTLNAVGSARKDQGVVDVVKGFFDPLGITKSSQADNGFVDAAQAMADYAKETRDRAERERARLVAQLDVAVSTLQAAIDRLSTAVREHYNRVAEIDRLRVHVKDNILYYMQAIWQHEPPDQRYFRLYNLDVPSVDPDARAATTVSYGPPTGQSAGILGPSLGDVAQSLASLPLAAIALGSKKLVEVADLDTVLGYKGNYTIFPLKDNNYLTLHMMQDYLDVGDELLVRDPDEAGNYTVDELQRLATCLYRNSPAEFEKHRAELKHMLLDRLTAKHPDDDLIIVPTSSLYIEALVGTHPLLEDFKLIHRALDVKRVQAEVRHAELENIRLAARALRGKDEDPDIERKIVVETAGASLALQPDLN